MMHCAIATPTVVGGEAYFPLRFALKLTHPFAKRQLRRISVL